ncbi:MAG: 50S ribosomal protein L23 [Ignavibacteriales bacterium]|nr:50S ribosomal protein L23 [Ignavibacteriales bacterium]
MHNILVKPLLTEKVAHLTETQNMYGFVVDLHSNKIEIKRAIETKFKVSVAKITTTNYKGKKKMVARKSGRFEGKRPDFKKAYVVLKKGDKIDLFEHQV